METAEHVFVLMFAPPIDRGELVAREGVLTVARVVPHVGRFVS